MTVSSAYIDLFIGGECPDTVARVTDYSMLGGRQLRSCVYIQRRIHEKMADAAVKAYLLQQQSRPIMNAAAYYDGYFKDCLTSSTVQEWHAVWEITGSLAISTYLEASNAI